MVVVAIVDAAEVAESESLAEGEGDADAPHFAHCL